jgi:hypothetical protein
MFNDPFHEGCGPIASKQHWLTVTSPVSTSKQHWPAVTLLAGALPIVYLIYVTPSLDTLVCVPDAKSVNVEVNEDRATLLHSSGRVGVCKVRWRRGQRRLNCCETVISVFEAFWILLHILTKNVT